MQQKKKNKINQDVLKEAKQNMIDSGQYTPEQIENDDYVYDQIIADKVNISNVKFNKLRTENLEGLKSLYMDNMALSGSDIVQTFLEVTPLHQIAKDVRGFKLLKSLANTKAGKKLQKQQLTSMVLLKNNLLIELMMQYLSVQIMLTNYQD